MAGFLLQAINILTNVTSINHPECKQEPHLRNVQFSAEKIRTLFRAFGTQLRSDCTQALAEAQDTFSLPVTPVAGYVTISH